MLPTLAVHGDTTWTSSRYRHGKGIAVGDLVLFKHPYVVGVEAIKRVVGMPGDFVMRDVHDEGGSQVMLQVPQGHCWVLGDNLTESRDSRIYGPVPLGLIRGKVFAKSTSLLDFQMLKNNLERPAAVS
ncbi:MAG: hypothetical protein Q9202_002882 [Teloschistes flavicans]